jgi:DNA mismatch endonuclease (patch repair protein)
MADVFSKTKRSDVMSRIRSHGNKETELALIAFLRLHGITGWRRRQPLFGKPDFVFREARVAVFVDGCFWHGCPRHGTRPKTNAGFWNEKIRRNIARDRLVNRTDCGFYTVHVDARKTDSPSDHEIRFYV